MGNVQSKIVVPRNYEVMNGLIGMGRDIFLKLCKIMLHQPKKIQIIMGITAENYLWSKHSFFLRTRLLAYHRKTPAPPPPARDDPNTLWFEKGQTLEMALAGRKSESIHAIGGAVEPLSYGDIVYTGRAEFPHLRFVDLRESGWDTIGDYWFTKCYELICVEFPPSLERIGCYAFSHSQALTEVWFPRTLRRIAPGAFFSTGLKELVFPPEFETLSPSAFSKCLSLQRVEFPLEMKVISSFDRCTALRTIVVGDVEEWALEPSNKFCPLGDDVKLKELRLTGRRWKSVPACLAKFLTDDARVIGPNFIGRKLGRFVVTSK